LRNFVVLFDVIVTFKFRIFDWCVVPSLNIRGLMVLISRAVRKSRCESEKKSRHTFRKVAKFAANSRCQFTVIYSIKDVSLSDTHFCSLPSQPSVMYRRLTK